MAKMELPALEWADGRYFPNNNLVIFEALNGIEKGKLVLWLMAWLAWGNSPEKCPRMLENLLQGLV